MKKILYLGHMRRSYARSDAVALKQIADVTVEDMAKLVWRHTQLPYYVYRYFTSIIWNIRKNDIIWNWTADYPMLPVILAAKVFGKKTVIHIDGYEVHDDPEVGYGIQGRKVRGWIARWILKHVDVVVTQSNDYKDRIVKLVPEANVMVKSESICLDTRVTEKSMSVMTAYCSYKNSDKIKGIETYKMASRFLPDVPFYIIKDQPHHKMVEFMERARVYCQLSFTEQFGFTVLEAMANGCVPVVTRRGSLPEIVGDAGLTVAWNDPHATHRAIVKALTMDGTKARERAAEYTMEKKVESLRRIVDA